MAARIDLNADLGEECGDDAAMLAVVTSANVSCGVHAGNPLVLHRTLEAAQRLGVTAGAHPSYPDRENFGRFPMALSQTELHAVLRAQIAAFSALNGGKVPYVKPHGALYNAAFADARTAAAVVYQAEIAGAAVMHLPGGLVEHEARESGVRFVAEAFADRAYRADGTLVSRGHEGAVLHDPSQVADRAVQIATTGTVQAVTGETIDVPAESLCLHGDTPGAVALAARVREALESAGVTVRALL